MKKIGSALISLSDKSDLKPLLQILKKNNVKLISSGGTFKKIKKLGFNCLEVSKFTSFNEILDGRVKTLHPKIHGGILAQRDNSSHDLDRKVNRIELIDIVAVNLYPFKETVAKPDVTLAEAIENIDIGGPSMVRSAAKNYKDVAVLTNPHQYGIYLDALKGNITSVTVEELRKQFMLEAFKHTAEYDAAISAWMESRVL